MCSDVGKCFLVKLSFFYVDHKGCVINVIQILLTTLNYSLICNTKARLSELIESEIILFGQIIYNGNLFILFIDNMQAKPKDYAILFISIIIANQVLMMDLMYRAVYEQKKREQARQILNTKKQENQVNYRDNLTLIFRYYHLIKSSEID